MSAKTGWLRAGAVVALLFLVGVTVLSVLIGQQQGTEERVLFWVTPEGTPVYYPAGMLGGAPPFSARLLSLNRLPDGSWDFQCEISNRTAGEVCYWDFSKPGSDTPEFRLEQGFRIDARHVWVTNYHDEAMSNFNNGHYSDSKTLAGHGTLVFPAHLPAGVSNVVLSLGYNLPTKPQLDSLAEWKYSLGWPRPNAGTSRTYRNFYWQVPLPAPATNAVAK